MIPHIKKAIFILMVLAVFLTSTSQYGSQPALAASHHSEIETAILRAFEYLRSELNDDGGIRWVDENSNVAASIRVVLGLAAAGFPQDLLVSAQGNRPIDFISQEGKQWIYQEERDDPQPNLARAGQLLTAVAAADENPYAFGPETVNLVHLIKTNYDPNSGVFGTATPENVTSQVWAILGLASAYSSIPQEAVDWLAGAQLDDGSWDDGFGSFLEMTPLAMMAMIASGYKDINAAEVIQAINFIKDHQQLDGGWQTAWDTTTNASTTGMILQAITAAEQNPSDSVRVTSEASPKQALLNLQREDGAIGGDFTNTYSTADAILGLSDTPLYNLGHLRHVGRAFEFIFAAQGSDGGWGSVGQTIDVIITARTAGWDPHTITNNGRTPIAYIADNLDAYIKNGPDAIGKTILGLVAAGQKPSDFNDADLVSILMGTYSLEAKAFGDPENTWHQSLGILGLSAVDTVVPDGVLQTLVNLQQADGGWEYTPGFGSWPDNTALAIQALLAAGFTADNDVIQNGLRYIRSQQLEDGGWGDASTSAFALMALHASGIDPVEWKSKDGKAPYNALFSFQKPSGAFMFSADYPDDNLMASSTAVLAAMGGDYLVYASARSGLNIAGLIIQTDQGEITTTCITFDRDSISGLELLDASGIPYQSQDGFMNSIGNLSNPQGGTMFWSYWHWDGREWIFNNIGAGDSTVFPGTIEAWYFTSWGVFPSPPPDFVPSMDNICGQDTLKNYTVQPYLHYYDLNEYTPSMTHIAAQDEVDQPGETSISSNDQTIAERLSSLPIFIISSLGAVVLILIAWILFKKKS